MFWVEKKGQNIRNVDCKIPQHVHDCFRIVYFCRPCEHKIYGKNENSIITFNYSQFKFLLKNKNLSIPFPQKCFLTQLPLNTEYVFNCTTSREYIKFEGNFCDILWRFSLEHILEWWCWFNLITEVSEFFIVASKFVVDEMTTKKKDLRKQHMFIVWNLQTFWSLQNKIHN